MAPSAKTPTSPPRIPHCGRRIDVMWPVGSNVDFVWSSALDEAGQSDLVDRLVAAMYDDGTLLSQTRGASSFGDDNADDLDNDSTGMITMATAAAVMFEGDGLVVDNANAEADADAVPCDGITDVFRTPKRALAHGLHAGTHSDDHDGTHSNDHDGANTSLAKMSVADVPPAKNNDDDFVGFGPTGTPKSKRFRILY